MTRQEALVGLLAWNAGAVAATDGLLGDVVGGAAAVTAGVIVLNHSRVQWWHLWRESMRRPPAPDPVVRSTPARCAPDGHRWELGSKRCRSCGLGGFDALVEDVGLARLEQERMDRDAALAAAYADRLARAPWN